jgi:eukaryotic-like serine/threonine-protein kinase
VNPGVPRDLDTICLKAMEKNPARRYQSAAELAADLRRFLAGEPVAARRVGVLGRVGKAARRRPLVAGLLAAMVAVVLGGAGAVTVLWQQAVAALDGERAARRDETAQRERTEAELAAKLLLLARIEWEAGDTARAAEYLRECPDRHRSRQWQYLDRACRAQVASFSHPTETIARVACSPDGRFLATVSLTGVLKAWDLATGVDVFTAQVAPMSRILELDFTPDGRRLAFSAPLPLTRRPKPAEPAPEVWQFRLWDVGTWRLARQGRFERHPPAAHSVAGAVRASADGGWMRVEDLVTGGLAEFPHGHNAVQRLAFNDGGRLLLSGGPNEPFKVWDVGAGRLVSETAARPLARAHPVLCEQLSSDGRRFAWYELPTGDPTVAIVVWDVERDEEVARFRVSHRTVGQMRLSPDGRSLAVVDGKAVRVWDLDTREEVVVLRGHAGTICDIAFGAGGRCLASVGRDDTVRVWDVRPFKE